MKPYILYVTPSSYTSNLPTNTIVRIAFSEYVKPGTGMIVFKNSENDILVNVENVNEVRCHQDVCTIEPSYGFEPGTYKMTFGEAAFVDYSGNTLEQGVSYHVLRIGDSKCSLSYVNVADNTNCKCQSVNNQCQCQCGETHFVKEYQTVQILIVFSMFVEMNDVNGILSFPLQQVDYNTIPR